MLIRSFCWLSIISHACMLCNKAVFPRKLICENLSFLESLYPLYSTTHMWQATPFHLIISPEQVLPDNESVLVLLWTVFDHLLDPIVPVPLFGGVLWTLPSRVVPYHSHWFAVCPLPSTTACLVIEGSVTCTSNGPVGERLQQYSKKDLDL